MMWGKCKENGIWLAPPKRVGRYVSKVIFGGGDRLIYAQFGRFRLRLMKPF